MIQRNVFVFLLRRFCLLAFLLPSSSYYFIVFDYNIIIPFHLPPIDQCQNCGQCVREYVCLYSRFTRENIRFVHAYAFLLPVMPLIGKTSAYSNSKDHICIRPASFFPEQVLPLIGKTSAYSNSKDHIYVSGQPSSSQSKSCH